MQGTDRTDRSTFGGFVGDPLADSGNEVIQL